MNAILCLAWMPEMDDVHFPNIINSTAMITRKKKIQLHHDYYFLLSANYLCLV